MAKQVKVVSVESIKQEIKGKQCDVIAINLLNVEKGTTKKEYIPSFNKVYSAAAVLNAGDICNATWEKKTSNGKDYYNLVELTRTGSGDVTTVQGVAPVGKTAAPTKSGFGKSPEEQLSISRQNVNNVAMNFVSNMLAQGVYPKKTTPDMLFEEIKRFAKKFEAYVNLKDDYSQLDTPAVTAVDESDGMLD